MSYTIDGIKRVDIYRILYGRKLIGLEHAKKLRNLANNEDWLGISLNLIIKGIAVEYLLGDLCNIKILSSYGNVNGLCTPAGEKPAYKSIW